MLVLARVTRIRVVVTVTAHEPAYVALFRAKQVRAQLDPLGAEVLDERPIGVFPEVWGQPSKPVL